MVESDLATRSARENSSATFGLLPIKSALDLSRFMSDICNFSWSMYSMFWSWLSISRLMYFTNSISCR